MNHLQQLLLFQILRKTDRTYKKSTAKQSFAWDRTCFTANYSSTKNGFTMNNM